MNNYNTDTSVIINGRSYYLSGWGSPEKDGSRKVFMRLNHNSLCQMMQQDGDDSTCTCLDELDFETCPNGHTATERMTDGMPIPCSTPSCTYYRRPVAAPTIKQEEK